MPSISIDGGQTAVNSTVRVVKNWGRLPLNPYLIYAAAMPMMGCAYVPLPDTEMLLLEKECFELRELWNTLALEQSRAKATTHEE